MEKLIMAAGCALRMDDIDLSEAGNAQAGGESTPKDKPAILLLHGFLETLEAWDELATLLAPRFRVVRIDLPGHGISQTLGEVHTMEFCAQAAAAAMEQPGIGRYLVAGHSMGGYVALEMLRQFPDRLSGLVLVNSTPDPDTDEKKKERQRQIGIIKAGKKDLLAIEAIRGRFAEGNRKRLADRVEEFETMAEVCEEAGCIALLNGMAQRADSNPVLEKTDVQVMLAAGKEDTLMPAENLERLRGLHPRMQVHVLENCAHMAQAEQPQRLAELILNFLP